MIRESNPDSYIFTLQFSPTSQPSTCRKAASIWSAGTGAFHKALKNDQRPQRKEYNQFLV